MRRFSRARNMVATVGAGRKALAVAFVLAAITLASGCVRVPVDKVPEWARPKNVVTETTTTASPSGESTSGIALPTGHHGIEVLMLGRSVTRGWFDHWGYNGRDPVLRDGYALYYAELAPPPDIATSAAGYIAQVPAGTIVFFKLCYVDFEASSAAQVKAKLAENVGYVEKVIAAARAQGVTLVIGNALPRVAGETTRELVDLHEQYNKRLDELAAANKGVYVFDLYGTLATDAVLPRGLAVSPDDSHLNDVAYQVLDEAFFKRLDEITGR